ncbi:alkaline phosphatase family protein [Methylobacterium sp. sgz302541]|uniref:alkaline phosphatase family protein n=1 Tax=unclassified Methylobacterium TaxID=2615210 RepID=UPI003D3253BA
MPRLLPALVLLVPVLSLSARAEPARPHNVVLFVPDGLRSRAVTPEHAPALDALRKEGVFFENSHALFPTFTMPNASAMATGHYLGDTGTYSNTIYTGFPVPGAGDSVTPFIESDPVLGDIDAHFAGDYMDAETLLKAARAKGYNTATIGKLGPSLVFDHTERTGQLTVAVDDQTGTPKGIPLAGWLADALKGAGLPTAAPTRGDNGKAGDAKTPGTLAANVVQQTYFADVTARAVLPKFKADDKPFLLVFWSRDPDGTQHNQGDSFLTLEPGINGPTSLASIRNADDGLARIRAALRDLGLSETTDIVVSADHGFSTISKQSDTSPAAKASYGDTPAGLLPPGFVALDLAKALGLPLSDPDDGDKPVAAGAHPKFGNGLIGADAKAPDLVVAANGGSDLVYLPKGDKALAARVVEALLAQDYVGGLFVDDALGPIPGALPLSAINLKGSAITPMPAIAVSFRSFATGCAVPVLCAVEVSDTRLQQGQGMHGAFSRADTHNFMAAAGPSFRKGFTDAAPTSNADIGMTIAHLMDLKPASHGTLVGRVMGEALPGGAMPEWRRERRASEPSATGLRTVLDVQSLGAAAYFDAAGIPGRTLGLSEEK